VNKYLHQKLKADFTLLKKKFGLETLSKTRFRLAYFLTDNVFQLKMYPSVGFLRKDA